MKRINWWKGQRVTYQELKKNIRDVEKNLAAVGGGFARTFLQPSAVSVNFSVGWGLPTVSATSPLETNVTLILSACCAASGAEYPLLENGYLFTSGNLIVSNDMYVYFKSGDVMLIEATDPGGLDFVLSGTHDVIGISADPQYTYTVGVGFVADKYYPTASGASDFVRLLNVSATDGRAITYSSAGYVSNDNEDEIRPYLTTVIPSGGLSAHIGNLWKSSYKSNPGWPRKYWNLSRTDKEFTTRKSIEEVADFSDEKVYLIDLDYFNHWCGIGAKSATDASYAVRTGTTVDLAASGHLSGLVLNATHIAVDDRNFPDPAGRYDARGYCQWLEEFIDSYPHFAYTSALPDEMTYWTRTTSGTPANKLSGYTKYNTQTAVSVASLKPLFIGSGVLSATSQRLLDTGATIDTPEFDVSHDWRNYVFGAYAREYNNTVYLYRLKEGTTENTIQFCGLTYNNSNSSATLWPTVSEEAIDIPGDTTGYDTLTLPRNNVTHSTVDTMLINWYGIGIHAKFGWEMDSPVHLVLYIPTLETDLTYEPESHGRYEDEWALRGHSTFYSTATSSWYHAYYSTGAGDPSGWQESSAWTYENLSASGLKIAVRPRAAGTTVPEGITSYEVTAVTADPVIGDDLSPPIYRWASVPYVGINNYAYDENQQAEFTQSYSRWEYTNTDRYLTFFENTDRYYSPVKLAVSNWASGSDALTGGSGNVHSFWLYNQNQQRYISASVVFQLPLTGTSGSDGWYCNVIPLEAPEDTDGWWCVALENATQNVHIYRINYPQIIYGWEK